MHTNTHTHHIYIQTHTLHPPYIVTATAYVWTDGSGLDYSLTTLPAGSSDTCVMMIQVPNMQTWNTQTCTTNLKVLCEKDDAGMQRFAIFVFFVM